MSLLPQVLRPYLFKALRPITILPANLRISSRVVLGTFPTCNGWHCQNGVGRFGFKRSIGEVHRNECASMRCPGGLHKGVRFGMRR